MSKQLTIEERKKIALEKHRQAQNKRGLQEVAYKQQQEKEEALQQFIPEHEKEYEEMNRKRKIDELTEKIADYFTEHHSSNLQGSMFDLSIRRRLYPIIEKYILDNKVIIPGYKEKELTSMLIDEIAGLGPIDEIIRRGEGSISEIWVNGENPITGEIDIYYEKRGEKYKVEDESMKFRDKEHAYKIARKIARNGQQEWGDSKPIANVRYPNGRVNLVRDPIATGGGGPYISFRLFPKDALRPKDLIEAGSMSEELWEFIKMSIKYGLNGLMVGSTGSGKTTLLTASLEAVPNDYRILLMEDTEEMRLRHKYPDKHIITEECKFNTRDEERNYNLSKLTTNALRQKPDYMIYGEVRDKAAYDMLNGANTGHRVWCTLHSRSAVRSVQRLKNMVMEHGSKMDSDSIGSWITESIDIIIFQKLYEDKVRRVKEVIELVDYKDNRPVFNTIFKFIVEGKNEDGTFRGKHYRTGRLSRETAEHLIHEGADIELVEQFMKQPEEIPASSFDSIVDQYYQEEKELAYNY